MAGAPWDFVSDWLARAAIAVAIVAGGNQVRPKQATPAPTPAPVTSEPQSPSNANEPQAPGAPVPSIEFVALDASAAAQPAAQSATQAPQQSAPAPAAKFVKVPRSIVDTGELDESDGIGALTGRLPLGATYQGSSFTATISGIGKVALPPGSISTPYRHYFTVTIDPGTGYLEQFIVQPPNVAATTPAPLLVAFHKYGVSQKDIPINTTFIQEAIARNWYLIAPLGAAQIHFSSVESQINTEAAIEWLFANFAIDRTHIYGVGFSMGGGAVLNYAARHLDPAHAMMAAVIDHSGSVALKDVYVNDPGVQMPPYPLDYWFGNGQPNSADPWKMARSSVINFDNITLAVEPDADLSRNLLHIAMRIVRASNDPVAYLSRESDVLDQHMKALGDVGGNHYGYYILPGTQHTWSLLNAHAACDWLATQTLVIPTNGNTLADHDGVYFRFTVEQDAAGVFTPFLWNFDSVANQLSLLSTKNLKRVTFDPIAAGLATNSALRLSLSTADGHADEVRVSNWPAIPSAVQRDGVASTSWSYSSSTKTLTISEFDGGAHLWIVTP